LLGLLHTVSKTYTHSCHSRTRKNTTSHLLHHTAAKLNALATKTHLVWHHTLAKSSLSKSSLTTLFWMVLLWPSLPWHHLFLLISTFHSESTSHLIPHVLLHELHLLLLINSCAETSPTHILVVVSLLTTCSSSKTLVLHISTSWSWWWKRWLIWHLWLACLVRWLVLLWHLPLWVSALL